MTNSQNLLKKFFGYDNFRPGQEEIINNILNQNDCLGIMPTGAGKSICYQIPAMLLPGVTIVISPLISLMKDQVDNLNQIGIPATFINSSLSHSEYSQTINNIMHNVYKIIYVAPERLTSEAFLNLLNNLQISMFTIDEAHCVSQWGHDFRPSYREIANVIVNLKTRPVVSAFTATATNIVKKDIINLLHLQNPFTLTTGFDRANLKFSVQIPENKNKYILNFLQNQNDIPGIIYCATRKLVDNLFEKLTECGYKVSKYHGGMNESARAKSQDDFVFDRTNIMIATNAFGMGIDKSNIRYVIHYNMPKDLESYYQEAGRAGRDGDNSECILLFSRSDIVTNKFLIEQTPSENGHKVEYDKLNDIIDYCNTDRCLRKYILEYFGEIPLFENCNNCSNCLTKTETTDITVDSKKILSCIKRMNERFGSGLVTDVLKGSKSSKIKATIIDFGGKNSITNYYSNLIGDLSDNKLESIYLGKDNQLVDINYIAELRGKKSNIDINVQGALKDQAKKHFKGTIDFKKGCKKATGNENEECMLLSNKAKSIALPMLLCSEEDVEGNHSSSAGKVGEKELFYIMSRGFNFKEAMKLMVRAKFNKILENIKDENLKQEILDEINTKLD